VAGTEFVYTQNFDYNTGIGNDNWVSIPWTGKYATASDIVTDIESGTGPGTDVYINYIGKWDASTQGVTDAYFYREVGPPALWGWSGGTDFAINPGDGITLQLSGNTPNFQWEMALVTPPVPNQIYVRSTTGSLQATYEGTGDIAMDDAQEGSYSVTNLTGDVVSGPVEILSDVNPLDIQWPVILRLYYNPAEVDNGSVSISRFDPDTELWVPVENQVVHHSAGYVEAELYHFSVYAAIGDFIPVAVIEAYQLVNVSLRVTGTKENSVNATIYEDSIMTNRMALTRLPGNPDLQAQNTTIRHHPGMEYTMTLNYTATNAGENPTWVTFTSTSQDSVYREFDTDNGYNQTENMSITSNLTAALYGNLGYYFNASESYHSDGQIVEYHWDFGDGTNATGIEAYHEYNQAGTYTVTLTVTDDEGESGEATIEVTVG